MSYKVDVIADSSGEWCSNLAQFATKQEASSYARDLACRWLSVREWRVVPSDDPVTEKAVWRAR